MEITAVYFDPAFRGAGPGRPPGPGGGPGVRARDKRHFLHASVRNTNGIQLYGSPGFRLRHRTAFLVARVPETVRPQ